MSNVLSQEEVDSLLKGVTTGEVETETGNVMPEDNTIRYDFTRQDQIIHARMPTFEVVTGRFVRTFRASLSTMVRKDCDVEVASLDMIKFEEFQRTLPVPTSLHVFRMEPLMGQALIIFDTRLVFSLIECYFGGKGAKEVRVEGRDFTPIETTMIRKVVGVCLKDYAAAWDQVHKLRMTYTRSEINTQFAAIVLPSDLVIVIRFDVDMEGVGGVMTICIPYSTLEPIRHRLYAGFQTDQLSTDANWRRRVRERVQETIVDMVVELGVLGITAEGLMGLKVGDVIQLKKDVSDPLLAKIEGMAKFKGRIGVIKGNRAIKIEERCLRSEAHV
jgi:flagellar motor switch protein FliM